MIKYSFAAAAILLVAACIPSNTEDVVAGKASAAAAASRAAVKAQLPQSDAAAPPAEIAFPSSVGEVTFRHQMHTKDLSIKCAECHHQINAKNLNTPHPDYLKSSWINCNTCHSESKPIDQHVYACSACHNSNPINIADETLSAKVVIHKKCWKCHEVSTGKEASKGCEKCHAGKNV